MNSALHLLRYSLRVFLYCSLWMCTCIASVYAQEDLSFKLHIPSKVIHLNQRLHAQLTLKTYKTYYRSLRLPTSRALRLRKRKVTRSKESVFVNGTVRVRRIWTIQLEYQARRTGFFSLSSARVRVGRKTYTTPKVHIEIRTKESTGDTKESGLPAHIRPRGDIFLLSTLHPKRVFIGQQATVTYYLFRRIDAQIDTPRLPRLPDFWYQAMVPIHPLGDWKTRRIGGKTYRYALALQYALYPLSAGKIPVRGLGFRYRRSYTDPSTQALWATSPTRYLYVRPLPTAKRPKSFATAHVGRLKLSITMPKQSIKAHRPTTFRVTLSGVGYIRQMTIPTFPTIAGLTLQRIRTEHDARSVHKQMHGAQHVTYSLVAQKPGVYTLPSVSVHFFDPWQQMYQTLRTQPQTIRVQKNQQQPLVQTSSSNTHTPKTKSTSTSSSRRISTVTHTADRSLWLGVVIFPVLLFLGFWVHRKRKTHVEEHEEHPDSSAQDAQLYLDALQKLRQESSHNSPDGEKLRVIESMLHQALSLWIHTNTRGLSRADLILTLQKHALPPSIQHDIQACLETCEMARFSPLGTSASGLSEQLQRILQHLPPTL